MKKPEEIKNGLHCCRFTVCTDCLNCPYYDDECCKYRLKKDALACIEQLEAQLAKKNNLIDVLEEENDENT